MKPHDDSVISDLEERMHLQPASMGKRLINFLIDLVLFYIIYVLVINLWGAIMVLNGARVDDVMTYSHNLRFEVYIYTTLITVFLVVYTFFEGVTKGRSLGKLVTGTKAVMENGKPLTWSKAFMRSLCRLIPFELFSGLTGTPWHDTITKTIVVNKR